MVICDLPQADTSTRGCPLTGGSTVKQKKLKWRNKQINGRKSIWRRCKKDEEHTEKYPNSIINKKYCERLCHSPFRVCQALTGKPVWYSFESSSVSYRMVSCQSVLANPQYPPSNASLSLLIRFCLEESLLLSGGDIATLECMMHILECLLIIYLTKWHVSRHWADYFPISFKMHISWSFLCTRQNSLCHFSIVLFVCKSHVIVTWMKTGSDPVQILTSSHFSGECTFWTWEWSECRENRYWGLSC